MFSVRIQVRGEWQHFTFCHTLPDALAWARWTLQRWPTEIHGPGMDLIAE